jgi:hypothetical protein
MITRLPHLAGPIAVAAGLPLIALAACSNGSASPSSPATGAGTSASNGAPAVTGQTSGQTVSGCTLVTAQQLSQAVGVKYTAVQSSVGSICNVTGASATDSFFYTVNMEDALNTWSAELATIKQDDGSYTSVSGIGDRAAQGAIKEFAAEADGYIVGVVNADVNNPATESSFARTKEIEKLLISKL